ncbi:MAG: ion channel [Brumimicrobium sp.]|nr:ion channel [Brumimicrobium sp.]
MIRKKKESLNTGFGSNVSNEGTRLLNKDGTFNTHKKGLSFFERFSMFHLLISMHWTYFFLLLLLGYTLINLLFATVYFMIGTDGIRGIQSTDGTDSFIDAFFFSAQTLTTVGYGAMSPASKTIGIVSTFESFIGLLGFALATGLLYGRFSKPKAKLLFSDYALISPYGNMKGLMIRVANQRDSQLINLTAKLAFSQTTKEGSETKRKFFLLPLEIETIQLLTTSWTIVHPIDEESPLYGISERDLKKRDIELMLFLEGYDETYAQNVHSRSSYKSSEILPGKRFKKILGHNDEGKATVQLDELSVFEEA